MQQNQKISIEIISIIISLVFVSGALVGKQNAPTSMCHPVTEVNGN